MSYTEEERDDRPRRVNHFIRGPVVWFAIVSGIVVIGVAGYGVWQVRTYIPYVGFVWLASSALLPTLGIGFLLITIIRYAMKADIIEIGPVGTAIRTLFGSVRVLTPLRLAGLPGNTTKVEEIAGPRVDNLGDVLEKNYIGPGSERFLLGMSSDNAPVYGEWSRVRSVIVAGISGMGKTVTMVFILIQIMLSKAAFVTVVDPHYKKPDGLTQRLKPLVEYGRFVHTDADTIQAVTEVKEELERRIAGQEWNHARLLVIDEWNRIASRNKEVFDLVKWVIEEIAQEGRGFDVYVILAGQIWQPSKSGGSSIINSFASVFLHRLKRQQSKFLGVDVDIQKQAEKLSPGNIFLSDASGDVDKLIIPECKYRDAVTVRDMLRGTIKELETPEEPLRVEAPRTPLKEHRVVHQGNYNTVSTPGVIEMQAAPIVNGINGPVNAVNGDVNVGNKRVYIDEMGIYPYTPGSTLETQETPVNEGVNVNGNGPVNERLKVKPEDIQATVLRLTKEYMPLGEIAKTVGLSGSQYDKFKAVLKSLNIDPVEYAQRREAYLNREKVQ